MQNPSAHYKNCLASDESPEFTCKQPDPSTRHQDSRWRININTNTAKLRQSFYDLVSSTTITYLPSTTTGAMPRSRSASFGDDDLNFISSQTAQMSINHDDDDPFASPAPLRQHEVSIIDLSQSPALKPTANSRPSNPTQATSIPAFGAPTQLSSNTSSFSRQPQDARQKQQQHDNMFIQRKGMHHDLYRSSGPLKPKVGPKKPGSQFPMLPSASPVKKGGYREPMGSYYAPPTAGAGGKATAAAADIDLPIWTDPSKANADLKALLEGGMDSEDEEEKLTIEDGVLEGIVVKLLPHQVEGVKWMRGRELGPIKRGKVPKGGILADDMGLGKTLQSISLIISNRMPRKDEKGWKPRFEDIKPCTLVVAPLALIRQWEAEIKEKVTKEHALKVLVHHGPQRTKDAKELGRYDVVITTYQILVSEHGNSEMKKRDGIRAGCFGVSWYRVILDEAHSIKNRNAKSTKACCDLRAEYRWCLTGTPMQNNLDELQSLVHFLRIQPYDDLTHWRENIDRPMKAGKGHIAIKRLHTLLRCFMKRRTKEILKEEGALIAGGKKALDKAQKKAEREGTEMVVPKSAFKITERKVVSIEAEFSPAEKEFYQSLEQRADASLEKMMQGKNVNYANALVLLLRLRQACNHPRLAETKLDKDRDALAVDTQQPKVGVKEEDLDALADAFGGMGIQVKKCDMCLSELSRKEVKEGVVRCAGCVEGLEKLNGETSERKKARRKSRRVSVVKEEIKIEKVKKKPGRGRKIVADSDDEDEEAEGSWIVPDHQRGSLRLGKAGGTDDEDAEGGGDDIGSEDSEHSSEEEEDDSQLDSFITNDEAKSSPARKAVKSEDDSDSESDDDTFVSVSKIHSQQVKQSQDSESGSDSDEGQSIPESELDSESDSEDDLPRARDHNPKPRSSNKRHSTSGGNNVMVSAKIRELLFILRKESAEHKFIVFSQFTSMLDLIEPFLRSQPGLKAVRYDGKMPNDAREAALKALRTDPHTRILLCSLKCGSLGLNLTAATRVIIVEPFWNPFVEEQAIDRVHRLTQTVDVVVYKLTVAGTVEARIVDLQNKKRLLAEAAVEGGMRKGKDKAAMNMGLQELLDLFKHDARREAEAEQELGYGVDGRVVSGDVRGVLSMATGKGKRTEDSIYGRRW
ncbi:SNF2 family N-terminal domain containing protein [Rhypophila sp. PSN 637]